jgi:hypothetical protein
MNQFIYPLLILALFTLGGCDTATPINQLALPPVSIIEGVVTQKDATGLVVEDGSGSIFVRVEMPDDKKLDVSVNDVIVVYGNLQAGPKKVFDAYVIKKPSGEQIIITDPSPHFGFVWQTSFK